MIGTAAALIALAPIQSASAQAHFAGYGQTANQIAVGASLDTMIGAPTGERATLLSSIDALPTANGRADALAQLSPQSYSLLPRLAIQSLDAGTAMLGQYLVGRRTAEADGLEPIANATRGDINMALLGDIRSARYEARPDRPAARTDSRSIAFAIDYQPREGMIVGLTLGIDGLDARLDPRRPRITLFNAHIGPYASITNGRVYLDGSLLYNSGDMKLRRQIDIPGFSNRLTAGAHSDGWAATAETGYMLQAKRIRIEPFAGLHYRYAGMDGFSERGGTAALDVAPYRTRSLQSSLGVRVSTAVVKGDWTIRPTAQADWRRELRGHADSRIEARFATADLGAFAFSPTRLARDQATVAANVSATYRERTRFRIGYAGQLSSDRRVHGLTLSVTRRF